MNLGLFTIVGSDTLSTTLSLCFHALAKYPEEQIKLVNEINQQFPLDAKNEPNTDNVKELKCMVRFIDEVLRLNPIAVK
jgi:cytochrome P450